MIHCEQAFNELNIYRKVMGRRLIHRRSISGTMAAAVYAACMEVGSPYTLRFIQLNRK